MGSWQLESAVASELERGMPQRCGRALKGFDSLSLPRPGGRTRGLGNGTRPQGHARLPLHCEVERRRRGWSVASAPRRWSGDSRLSPSAGPRWSKWTSWSGRGRSVTRTARTIAASKTGVASISAASTIVCRVGSRIHPRVMVSVCHVGSFLQRMPPFLSSSVAANAKLATFKIGERDGEPAPG